MPTLKHIHTYAKFKARPGYFKCMAPDCNHYCMKELAVGKNSLCTSCGTPFILDNEAAKRAKPRCLSCSDTAKARLYQATQKLLSTMPVMFKEFE